MHFASPRGEKSGFTNQIHRHKQNEVFSRPALRVNDQAGQPAACVTGLGEGPVGENDPQGKQHNPCACDSLVLSLSPHDHLSARQPTRRRAPLFDGSSPFQRELLFRPRPRHSIHRRRFPNPVLFRAEREHCLRRGRRYSMRIRGRSATLRGGSSCSARDLHSGHESAPATAAATEPAGPNPCGPSGRYQFTTKR